MGKVAIVLGPSGSGKSRSIKNLNPDTTIVINVLKKDLPFKGSRNIYTTSKNMVNVDKYDQIISVINTVSKTEHIKTIVIDDARFIMEKELFSKANVSGYGKFTEIALHFQQVIEAGENSRDDLLIILMLHDDDVINDKTIVSKKVKSVGKMVEEHYNPIEVVTICLYCKPSFNDKSGVPVYQFYTRKVMVDGVEYPAKTPEDMFETDTIPNDLNLVIEAINNYYN